jgi:hypothetical protein
MWRKWDEKGTMKRRRKGMHPSCFLKHQQENIQAKGKKEKQQKTLRRLRDSGKRLLTGKKKQIK